MMNINEQKEYSYTRPYLHTLHTSTTHTHQPTQPPVHVPFIACLKSLTFKGLINTMFAPCLIKKSISEGRLLPVTPKIFAV